MPILTILESLFQATLRMATPLIYTAIGETFGERSGIINLGLEGLMLIGAAAAYIITFYTGSIAWGILGAALIAGLFGVMFGFVVITLKANQIVTGTALNLIALGLTSFIYRALFSGKSGLNITPLPNVRIPFLSDIPFLGPIFFQQNWMGYGAFILTIAAAFILNKTMLGIAIKAVGEHPRAVATAGFSVSKLRYGATIFTAIMAGIGGAYLPIAYANIFVENMVAGRGYIAMAIVVFGQWNPIGAFLASLLFGFTYALQLRLQTQNMQVAYQFLQILPYLATVVVMILLRGQSAQPKSLGVPYTEQG